MDFSLEPLEYDRLKKLIGRYIRGSAAQGLLAAMRPTTDQQDLESRHALNGEAMEYLGENRVPFADLQDNRKDDVQCGPLDPSPRRGIATAVAPFARQQPLGMRLRAVCARTGNSFVAPWNLTQEKA